jgi:hypothetical protein
MTTSLLAGHVISKTRSAAEKPASAMCETADSLSLQPSNSPAARGIADVANAGRLSPVEASSAWHHLEFGMNRFVRLLPWQRTVTADLKMDVLGKGWR